MRLKKFALLFFFNSLGLLLFPQQNPINFASYNIRYDNPNDGENAWSSRKESVKNLVTYHNFDIFGVQEALQNQVNDLITLLPQYAYIGVGREDGATKGEYAAIFYNKKRFRVLEKGHFWLSSTPNIPSVGWDASLVRICCWGKFEDRETEKNFYVFNTHFDHVGVQARTNSAIWVSSEAQRITKGKPVATIIMGDFNSTPESEAYKEMAKAFLDAKVLSAEKAYGPDGTFNNFDYNGPLSERIDYIFVNKRLNVLKYATLIDSKDKHYPSDHLPVVMRAVLK